MAKPRPLDVVPHSIEDPQLRRFLEQIIERLRIDAGSLDVASKRPTVQELIDAGVTNADQIE